MTRPRTTDRPRPRWTLTAMLLVLLLAASVQTAVASQPDRQQLRDMDTDQAIPGAVSLLDRSSDAITSTTRTAGAAGHAVTIWYVVFNAPELCKDVDPDTDEPVPGACDADDIFLDPAAGGAGGFNATQIEAARISVLYGGDGAVVNPGGRLSLDGGIGEGEVPSGPAQVVIGRDQDGAMAPEAVTGAVVTGLEDARAAEVHIVLQDHGPAHQDPDLLESQLTGFRTACNPTPASQNPPEGSCDDVQYSVHK